MSDLKNYIADVPDIGSVKKVLNVGDCKKKLNNKIFNK